MKNVAETLSKVRVFMTELSMLSTRLGEINSADCNSARGYLRLAIKELQRFEADLVNRLETEEARLKKYCETLDEFRPPL